LNRNYSCIHTKQKLNTISEVSEPLRNFGEFDERRGDATLASVVTSLICRRFLCRARRLRRWPGSCDVERKLSAQALASMVAAASE
jgi:hypothetical protein